MNLTTQRRLASKMLKVGKNRVWLDQEALEDIEGAVTREDVVALINEGVIGARPEKGTGRARARKIARQKSRRKRAGHGSRKGSKGARFPRKRRWVSTIRAIRKELTSLRRDNRIGPSAYRRLYLLAKGGSFKNKAHLHHYIREHNLATE